MPNLSLNGQFINSDSVYATVDGSFQKIGSVWGTENGQFVKLWQIGGNEFEGMLIRHNTNYYLISIGADKIATRKQITTPPHTLTQIDRQGKFAVSGTSIRSNFYLIKTDLTADVVAYTERNISADVNTIIRSATGITTINNSLFRFLDNGTFLVDVYYSTQNHWVCVLSFGDDLSVSLVGAVQLSQRCSILQTSDDGSVLYCGYSSNRWLSKGSVTSGYTMIHNYSGGSSAFRPTLSSDGTLFAYTNSSNLRRLVKINADGSTTVVNNTTFRGRGALINTDEKYLVSTENALTIDQSGTVTTNNVNQWLWTYTDSLTVTQLVNGVDTGFVGKNLLYSPSKDVFYGVAVKKKLGTQYRTSGTVSVSTVPQYKGVVYGVNGFDDTFDISGNREVSVGFFGGEMLGGAYHDEYNEPLMDSKGETISDNR